MQTRRVENVIKVRNNNFVLMTAFTASSVFDMCIMFLLPLGLRWKHCSLMRYIVVFIYKLHYKYQIDFN